MGGMDVAIGSRLRAMRQARSMTLEQVAERVGVRAQQVQKYETGQNRITAARLFDFARLFGVPVAAFFDSVERVSTANADAPDPADRRAQLLAVEFEKLPEAQKQAVLSLVRSLSGGSGKPYGT